MDLHAPGVAAGHANRVAIIEGLRSADSSDRNAQAGVQDLQVMAVAHGPSVSTMDPPGVVDDGCLDVGCSHRHLAQTHAELLPDEFPDHGPRPQSELEAQLRKGFFSIRIRQSFRSCSPLNSGPIHLKKSSAPTDRDVHQLNTALGSPETLPARRWRMARRGFGNCRHSRPPRGSHGTHTRKSAHGHRRRFDQG
jgi:hypothetical protein